MDIGTRLHVDNGALVVERFQDCIPIAEHAKTLNREGYHGSSDFKHAATIPNLIIERYCNDHNILFSEFMQNKEHLKRVLNDPSLSAFRIWQGRV